MSNIACVNASFDVETGLSQEEFSELCSPDNITEVVEVVVRLANGKLHRVPINMVWKLKLENFEEDMETEEETEKPLSNKPSDHKVTAPTTMLS